MGEENMWKGYSQDLKPRMHNAEHHATLPLVRTEWKDRLGTFADQIQQEQL